MLPFFILLNGQGVEGPQSPVGLATHDPLYELHVRPLDCPGGVVYNPFAELVKDILRGDEIEELGGEAACEGGDFGDQEGHFVHRGPSHDVPKVQEHGEGGDAVESVGLAVGEMGGVLHHGSHERVVDDDDPFGHEGE